MKNFFTTLVLSCVLGSMNTFAGNQPETLSIKGSALNEGTEFVMKKDGTIFELYTSLKTGDYSFTDPSIAGISIQVEAEAGKMIPYRIAVDYTNETPIVTANKVTSVRMWAPWSQYTITDLQYIGNSQFSSNENTPITYDQSKWGDHRYRFKIQVENEPLRTYGGGNGFELALGSNSQWGGTAPLTEKNFSIDKYSRTKPFIVTVSLSPEQTYTHSFKLPEGYLQFDYCYIEGDAVLEGSLFGMTVQKLSDGIFELCATLIPGSLAIVAGTTGEGDYYLTSGEENQIVTSRDESTIQITREGVYLIRLNVWTKTIIAQEIKELFLWYFKDDNPNKHAIDLTYQGSGVFKGRGYFEAPTANYDGGNETRHKFTALTETGERTYIDRTVTTPDYPKKDETEDPNFYVLKSSGSNYDKTKDALRMRVETRNKYLDMEMKFDNATSKITYKYRVSEDQTAIKDEKINNKVYFSSTTVENEFTVSTDKPSFNVSIYNIAGSCVKQISTANNSIIITRDNLTSGIYIVKVIQNGIAIATRRIIVL